MDHRNDEPWTPTERQLWGSLKRALPEGEVHSQWWMGELPYRVDFFLPTIGLVVEVDGASHRGKERADRERSRHIKDAGYDVSRVTTKDVEADADRIATQIASRFTLFDVEETFDEAEAA
jgi:very-short-patch-repair endonuclease